MIDLDLERLAVDREYWDSVAPEEAEALIDENQWSLWNGKTEFVMYHDQQKKGWYKSIIPFSKKRYLESESFTIITRPQASSEKVEEMIDYNEQRRRNQAIAQNGNDGYVYATQDINDMVDELNETMAADLLADIICDMSDDDWHRFAHEILMRLATDKEHDKSFIYDQLVERRLKQISNPEGCV